MYKKLVLSALAATSLLIHVDLEGATITWTGSVNQLMSDTANWNPQQVPLATDVALFNIPSYTTAPPHPPSELTTNAILNFGEVDFETATPMTLTGHGTLTVGTIDGFVSNTSGVASSVKVGNVGGNGTLQAASLFTDGPAFNGVAGSTLQFIVDYGGQMTVSGGGQTGAGLASIVMGPNSDISTLATSNLTINTLPATFDSVSSSGTSNVITVNSGLTTGNASSQTIAGTIAGAGTLTLVGSGTLTLTNDNSSFAGTTNITAGGLSLPTSTSALGGTVNLTGGVLSGIGTIGSLGNTFTSSGGIIHPGNSPGIITVIGNHVNSGAGLAIDIQGIGTVPGVNNSELVVEGTETITNSPVVTATSLDGSFSISGPYTIVHSTGALTGTFDPDVVAVGTSIVPILTYDTNNVYLNYQLPFFALAENINELNVAIQLASITDPTAAETTLLTNLTALSTDDIITALDELSGSQYVEMQGATELMTQRFVRRLYDPLRIMISTVDSCGCLPSLPCGTVWMEGSGQRTIFDGNHNAHGFKASGYEVSGGIQGMVCYDTLLGVAATYDSEHYNFNIGGSSGKNQSILGAVYALYRPSDFYLLGDLVFGGSRGKIHREFAVGPVVYDESARPKSYEGILYVEGGFDYLADCGCLPLLIQPFLGLEGGYYYHKSFSESGTDPVQLAFHKKSYGTFDTRLGAHFSTTCPDGWLFALDLAWKYRWTNLENSRTVFFEEFGSAFPLQGADINRNAFDGSINITKQITEVWGVYVTATGQKWSNANSYDITGGITASW